MNRTEYQSIPFWSWNDKLEEQELRRQIRWMKDNGIGGFFMHARGGLKTKYLSEEWMQCIDACVDEATKNGMQAWVYDENGWPSGFAGGALLEKEENRNCYLTYTIGAFDEDAYVNYQMGEEYLVRVQQGTREGEYLNVYLHISVSTVDILNQQVVKQFIEHTHEQYKKRYGAKFSDKIKGFFTDEPQYYRDDTAYSKMLETYFREQYREDILDNLGLLFVEKKGYRNFRYKYWRACQHLMLDNFGKQIYEWCEENKVQFTGHYVEENFLGGQMVCCAGVMPFYKYMHRPGIDWLGRGHSNPLALRQLASVAQQYDKKHTLTETFGCCGWDITPMELKVIAEFQYVGGLNQMCHHLLPYSEHGQRKRDYPAHYSEVNPWVREYFKEFNDYFTNLGYLISNSKEVVNVAVLHPIRSAYFDYKRNAPGFGVAQLDEKFANQIRMLSQSHLMYHFVDETLLAEDGCVEDGKISCGKCNYDYLILPTCYTMDRTTEKLVCEFVRQGGKILLLDEKPKYLEGEEYTYDYLESNVTLDEILVAQPFTVSNRELPVHSACRRINGEIFLCVQNYSDEEICELTFKLQGDYCSFEKLDIQTNKRVDVPLTVQLKPGEMQLLFFSRKEAFPSLKKGTIHLRKQYELVNHTGNYLVLDTAQYSKDNITYGAELSCMGIFKRMLEERYEGPLFLKTHFHVKVKPEHIWLLAETEAIEWVKVNGTEVMFEGSSDLERNIFKADIAKFLTEGENEVLVRVRYYQSDAVYYALFGENVTETLRNCLVYDTDIEPMYLFGDFGVYEKKGFWKGTKENVLLGAEFYIGEKTREITNLVQNGFPFFAGNIRLKQSVFLTDTNVCLELEGKFQAAKIFVNGEETGVLLLNNCLDISRFTRVGNNDIEVELTVSNRNLLGPHHYKPQEEPVFVSVDTFELGNSWKNGISPKYRDTYSFVKVNLS